MLSRSIPRSTRTHIYPSGLRCERIRTPIRPQPRRDQHASPGPQQPPSKTTHNERPKKSIRPFTVLVWCIPIGYGINWALKQQDSAGQVSPDGFVKYVLATKEAVSSTCSIFTLIPSSPAAIDTTTPELARSIKSVQFKQPQLQIARSYTLLPTVEGQDEDELRFLIKKEQKGEVSGYLHRLPLDAEVEVRGISRECVIPEGVNRVVFLAGGTGIAPAMQIADILKGEQADVHILWANRKREDCSGGRSDAQTTVSKGSWWNLLRLWSNNTSSEEIVYATPVSAHEKHQIVRELDEAKASNSSSKLTLRVDYFVDEESTFLQPRDVSRILQGFTGRKKLLVVSGPEGFVNYWAGPKQWLNGREVQGPLAGALGSMDMKGWEVVKL